MSEADTKALLDQLVGEEMASYRDGRLSGFTLTPAGRSEHARLLAEELDAHGVRDAVQAAYQRFLGRNGDLLSVCTVWQLRDVDGSSTMNDHSDPAYDAEVIEQLGDVHGHVAADLRGAGAIAGSVRQLRPPPDGGARPSPLGRRRLVHEADDRQLPHHLVRAARRPPRHPRHRARRKRRRTDGSGPVRAGAHRHGHAVPCRRRPRHRRRRRAGAVAGRPRQRRPRDRRHHRRGPHAHR